MKADTIQTNFTSGEISPMLMGRVDLAKYYNGVQILENFIVRPQGAAVRRTGTYFVEEVKFSAKKTKLLAFSFSSEENYILEIGDLYIRFYREGGRIEVMETPVEVVTPYAEADLDALYFTQSADVLFICHPSYAPRTLTRNSHTSWTMAEFLTDDGPYLSPNTDTTKVVWLESVTDVATLTAPTAGTFVAGDVNKYIEYNRGPLTYIAKITAVSGGGESATVTPVENIVTNVDSRAVLTYSAPNVTASFQIFSRYNTNSFISWASNSWGLITTFTNTASVVVDTPLTMRSTIAGVIMNGRTITATAKAHFDAWAVTDVGRKMRFNFTGDQIWGEITAYTSARQVTILLDTLPPLKETDGSTYKDDLRTSVWRMGAWCSVQGYPSCLTFHEERLVFAATPKQPQTVWMSKSGEYSNFSPTEPRSEVLDNSAISYTLASNQVNAIQWMQSGIVMLIGTTGGEWQVKSTSIVEPITPTNIVVSPQTAMGSLLKSKPLKVGSSTVFLHKSGKQVRELMYKFDIDAFVANDLAILSEHIFRQHPATLSTAYQQTPASIIWVLLDNGQLAGLTFVKEQEVYAWHRQVFGGTNALVKDIAVVPSTFENEDIMWLIVSRTIGGSTKQYIEYVTREFIPLSPSDKDEMFYVDSGLSYEGAPVTTVSGMSHLAGETVHCVADGKVVPAMVVSGAGSITLPFSASFVTAGLPYTSTIKTVALEGGGEFGTSQGKTKRLHKVTLRVLDSLGFKHGQSATALTQASFRTSSGAMDNSPLLKTEDVDVTADSGYGKSGSYYFVQDQPYPLTILAVVNSFVTHSGAS